MQATRITLQKLPRLNPGLPHQLSVAELAIVEAEHVHLHPGSDQRNHRVHVLWNARRYPGITIDE